MREAPTRLKTTRVPLVRGNVDGTEGTAWPGPVNSARPAMVRPLRAIRRAFIVLAWTLIALPVQALLMVLPGRGRVAFARCYWATMCWLIGLDVRVIGAAAPTAPGARPVMFVSNHSSWLDILVLGGRLEACFVSKDEVAGWPVLNLVAKLGRTVFVRRQRGSTVRERDDMRGRMATGDNLILFPEGTTSDGSRVMPFRSAFLSVAEQAVTEAGLPPLVQPISVVYDRLGGLPIGRANRPVFAWYGDMDIASHFWRLAQNRGLRATVLLHTPLDPRHFASRKDLSAAAWSAVADGAATLRQNRPAQPKAAPVFEPGTISDTPHAAFA